MISLKNASHHYDYNTYVPIPDIELGKGESLLIMGLSGSGKSTLLHILGGILKPTTGTLKIDGNDIYSLQSAKLDQFRGQNIGIIFQQMHLIDSLSVHDNLQLAQFMAGQPQDLNHIQNLCEKLGLSDQITSLPGQLSQGEKQRVGIARAVINNPIVILADEPTSSLDDKRCENVIQLLKRLAKTRQSNLIISTHDQRVKEHFRNIINLDTILEDSQ